jgi:hypothetical protein
MNLKTVAAQRKARDRAALAGAKPGMLSLSLHHPTCFPAFLTQSGDYTNYDPAELPPRADS